MNFWHLILSAGPVGKLTLLVLFFLSVFTWAVIIVKFRGIRESRKGLEELAELIDKSTNLVTLAGGLKSIPEGLAKRTVREYLLVYSRLKKDFPAPEKPELRGLWFSSLKGLLIQEWERLREEKTASFPVFLGFLATVGNTAPFIGLFGTVWGIMVAFHRIGLKGSASLATVAPGIAEALIATAMGLFAAIPAVVAYNYFTRAGEAVLEDLSRIEKRLVYLCEKDLLEDVLS